MLQEVHVLRLRHRNLVNFHHVWLENSQLSTFGPPVPTLYLLQEVTSPPPLNPPPYPFNRLPPLTDYDAADDSTVTAVI